MIQNSYTPIISEYNFDNYLGTYSVHVIGKIKDTMYFLLNILC